MVTKLLYFASTSNTSSVLAKILMVTKRREYTENQMFGSVLAKILMVTKLMIQMIL